jgi:hypothetical protein
MPCRRHWKIAKICSENSVVMRTRPKYPKKFQFTPPEPQCASVQSPFSSPGGPYNNWWSPRWPSNQRRLFRGGRLISVQSTLRPSNHRSIHQVAIQSPIIPPSAIEPPVDYQLAFYITLASPPVQSFRQRSVVELLTNSIQFTRRPSCHRSVHQRAIQSPVSWQGAYPISGQIARYPR